MIVFGVTRLAPWDNDEWVIVNYSSEAMMDESFSISCLFPTFDCRPFDDKQSDILYANYIEQDRERMYRFLSVFANSINIGSDVYVCVSESDLMEAGNDMLMKYITARYIGVIINNVRSEEDLIGMKETLPDAEGVLRLNADMQLYQSMFIERNGIDEFNKINEAMNGEYSCLGNIEIVAGK